MDSSAIRKQNGAAVCRAQSRKNAGWLLAAPGMPDARRKLQRPAPTVWLVKWSPYVPPATVRSPTYARIQTWKPYLQMERGFLPDDALVVDGGLGKFYFLPDLKVIDYQWGLTDATVARTPVTHSNLKTPHSTRPLADAGIHQRNGASTLTVFAPTFQRRRRAERRRLRRQLRPRPLDAVRYCQCAVGNRPFRRPRPESQEDFLDRRTCPQPLPCRRLHAYVGERIIAHFENGFEGWQPSGAGRQQLQPARKLRRTTADLEPRRLRLPDQLSPQPRETGRPARPSRPPSPPTADQYLAFLIAGGNTQRESGCRLLADGDRSRGLARHEF